jgi:hypothetical protein
MSKVPVESANLEHSVPVAAGTRQAGSLQGEDSADFFQGDIGHQGLEILAVVDLRAGQAQVPVQQADLVVLPTQAQGSVLQGVLSGGALLVIAHLAHGRLAQIDVSHLLTMVGLDLGYHQGSAELEAVGPGRLAASFGENWRRASRPCPNRAGCQMRHVR